MERGTVDVEVLVGIVDAEGVGPTRLSRHPTDDDDKEKVLGEG